jgi:DNA repair protein RadC
VTRSSTCARDGPLGAAPHERPRERMLLYGGAALGDVELVALVLGGGRSMRRAIEVLERVGGMRGLAAACPHELLAIEGVGEAGATALCAALELARRTEQLALPFATPMRGPEDVTRYLRALLGDAQQETFVVLGLDARQRVRLVRTVAVGSVAQVDVHPREVFRPLVRAAMHSVVLVHNHPSGEPEPSAADLELTRRLVEVGRVVGIPVLDHLVVTRTRSVSLAALGEVPGAK